MRRTIYLIMMHFASHLYAQGISGYLHINRKPNVNWWAGIIREGHKMPFKNGYEANLYGQCWRNQLQPLFLSTDGELIWSEESFRFEFNENKIIITDYQFLSSLINNSKTSPNKWYDDLSVPSSKNEFFKKYKNFYFKRLKEQNIIHVYVVEKSKRKFIDILFKDQNCLKETDLNNKLIKFKIDNCIF